MWYPSSRLELRDPDPRRRRLAAALVGRLAAAAARARAVLEQGGDALAAAIEATVYLEDDPRFNAGTGANLRLDGQTVEMDASVMCSDGRFGGVACIERVKNPVRVAARVMKTPHLLLVGAGATAFARRLGFPDHDPATDAARHKHARALAELRGEGDGAYVVEAAPWRRSALASIWNFPGDPPPVAVLHETPAPHLAPTSPETTAARAATRWARWCGTGTGASPPRRRRAARSTCCGGGSATRR